MSSRAEGDDSEGAMGDVIDLGQRRPGGNLRCTTCGGEWFDLAGPDGSPPAVIFDAADPLRITGLHGQARCHDCGCPK